MAAPGLPGGLRITPRLFIVKGSVIVGGEGLVEILEAVRESGSLAGAAEMLGMSYRKLWAKLRSAERMLGVRLVESGRGRGGSRLTHEAVEILEAYRRLEARLRECLGGAWKD